MAKYFVIVVLWSVVVFGQNSATPLNNETIIRLVASGVPAETIINTIRSASAVNFGFLTGDLTLFQRYNVPDDVVKAMAAKSNGKPIPNFSTSAPVVPANVAAPQVQPQPTRPTAITESPRVVEPQAVLTNDSVLKLVKAGMGEDVILSMISSQSGQYSLSTDSLIALKQAGASDRIMAAIVNRNSIGSTNTIGTRSTNAVQPSSGEAITLHDGLPVRMRLSRNLSSADAKTGDTVDFEVLEDVKVDDLLVVARGGTAIATVTQAEHKKRMARGGKLDIAIEYVRLVNGDKVALRAIKETSGGGHTGAMTGAIVATSLVFFPAAPFFLFMHGKDTTIPKGTEITAYVNGEIKLDRQKLMVKQ